MCYENYIKFCEIRLGKEISDSYVIKSEPIFHRERKILGVYLEKAYDSKVLFIYFSLFSDQYSSVKYINLIKLRDEKRDIEYKEKLSKKEKERIQEIEVELIPLENFINDARKHCEQIKLEIGK